MQRSPNKRDTVRRAMRFVADVSRPRERLLGPRQRALTSAGFYALGGGIAHASLVVGAWPATDTPVVFWTGMVAFGVAAGLAMAGRYMPDVVYHVVITFGVLLITIVQVAGGSATAAAVYGFAHVLVALFAALFVSPLATVGHLLVIAAAQTSVVLRIGSVATGDPRGLAAQVMVTVGACAAVGIVVRSLLVALSRTQRALSMQARVDSLTGLPNQATLQKRTERALRSSPHAVALLSVDIDRLREVNDAFGSAVGDALLVQVAHRVATAIRRADFLARVGGDEFAVLVPAENPATTLPIAQHVAKQVLFAVQQPFEVGEIALAVEANVGLALGRPGMSARDLMRQADRAQREAKGKAASVAVADGVRERDAHERLALLTELRTVLVACEQPDAGRAPLYFQPKVDLKSGEVVGAEALVRWEHPSRGLIAAGEFVPLLEHTSLIHALTRHVISEALLACARWREQDLELAVSINVSARDLTDVALPDVVAEQLGHTAVPPGAFTVEVTETALMADAAEATRILNRLRALGVGVAVDEFGTGWSSLSHLQRLPLTELKVGRAFVVGMRRDPDAGAIVAATVRLGQSLGLNVVAEGVEDAETRARLTTLGCNLGQGWLFGKPMTAADLAAAAGRPPVPRQAPGGLRGAGSGHQAVQSLTSRAASTASNGLSPDSSDGGISEDYNPS